MTTFTKRLASIAATAAGIFLLASCGNGNAPSELRCEYQEGYDILIDTQSPRLSWINNCQQTAYQILVATDKALLKEGETDLWDSGRTEGSESHLVKYSGNLMPSMEDCWWTVRIWDAEGKASRWAEPAHWTTGMFNDTDWQAEWIGASWQDDNGLVADNAAPIFRKEFKVDGELACAKAFVCGLGWFEMAINGDKVGDDFFAPGLTDYTARPKLLVNPKLLSNGALISPTFIPNAASSNGFTIIPLPNQPRSPPRTAEPLSSDILFT